jgi:hypothetical protein
LGEATPPPASEPETEPIAPVPGPGLTPGEIEVATANPDRPVAAAEPEPARNPEAERFAQERGLGSSQTAEQQTAEAQTGSESDAGFTDRESELLRQVDAETRNLPFPIEGVDLSKLSPRERKMATILAYEAMKYNPQNNDTGENIFDYRERMRGVMAKAADTMLPADTSLAMRRLMRGAFDVLSRIEGNGTPQSNPQEAVRNTAPEPQPENSTGTPESGNTAGAPSESSTASSISLDEARRQRQQQNGPVGEQGGQPQPGPNTEQAQGPLSPDEMHDFLVNAQSEARPFPYELNADRDLNQYSPQAIKIATALVHLTDNVQPRPNESPRAFAARKVAMIKESARRARSMVGDIPRSDQGHYRMAADILFNIQPTRFGRVEGNGSSDTNTGQAAA